MHKVREEWGNASMKNDDLSEGIMEEKYLYFRFPLMWLWHCIIEKKQRHFNSNKGEIIIPNRENCTSVGRHNLQPDNVTLWK